MKKYLLIFLLFCQHSNAQWNYFAYLDTYMGSLNYGSFEDAEFMSVQTGFYAYSFWYSASSGTAIHQKVTTDSANSWVLYSHSLGIGNFFKKYFSVPSQNTIYSIDGFYSSFTNIARISDPGLTFVHCAFFNDNFYDLHTRDTAYFYVLKSYGGIQKCLGKYSNGIFNSNFYTFNGFIPQKLFFPDSLNGYIIGDTVSNYYSHSILKTQNGGISWSNVFSDTSFYINKIYFIDSLNGFAVGNGGRIMKTTDGALTMQNLNSGFNVNFNSVYFLDNTFGFAGGDSGVIIRTIDGGNNWTQDSRGFTASIKKIFFVNDSNGFALAGNSLYMINIGLGNITWQPDSLYQPFLVISPNPTKGIFSVTIPRDFQNDQNVILNIFDTSGKLIQQLPVQVNQGKINLNLKAKANGVYHVNLSNGKKSYNGKIVFE